MPTVSVARWRRGHIPLPVVYGEGEWGGLRFRKPFTLSRALTESPTSRPSPRNGEGRAASLRSYSRDPIGGGRRACVGNDFAARFVGRRRQSVPEIERRTYLCRHGETVQPNFKPPREIEQAIGPDEYETSETGAIGPKSLGICAVKLFMPM